MRIGTKYCTPSSLRYAIESAMAKNDGMFYTDPYFGTAFETSGYYREQQFIRPGSKELYIRRGRYSSLSEWMSELAYVKRKDHAVRRLRIVETSLDLNEN